MVKKRKHDYGKVGVPVFYYTWDEWKETELWLDSERVGGIYNPRKRAIVVLGDYSSAKRDEVHGKYFLKYPDDQYKVVVQHEYVHVLQHLIAYSKGLSVEDYVPIYLGAPPSSKVRKNYEEGRWLLEDEAVYLELDLPKLIEIDKEVCNRKEVQRAVSDYMKGYWGK